MTTINQVVAAAPGESGDLPGMEVSDLPGVNIMLMGPAGTGKTDSIGTIAEISPDLEVFYLGLEPGLETLLGHYKRRKLPMPKNLHWHSLESAKASFSDLLDGAKRINTMSLETLAKTNDPNRSKHNRFIKLLEVLNNFPDDRTGQKFGCVDTWGPNRILIIDGMAGLARMAMSLVVGNKPVKNVSDWGIAQDQIEKVINLWTDACKCHFILIAHVEREKDEVLGGIKLMVSTLGAKLAPKLPAMFSDVILSVREGSKFSWDTANGQADVKTRNLAISAGLTPDFKPIFTSWLSRGGKFVDTVRDVNSPPDETE
jgi:hypothetical protein